MKREIKFRGISIDTNEWLYGSLQAFNDGTCTIMYKEEDEKGYTCPVTPESVGQFTGLKDKNGVDIYEGDIVVRKEYPYFDGDERNYVATIEWIFNGWNTVLHCVNPKKNGISSGLNAQIEDDTEYNTDFEVIGNIHESATELNNE